MTEVLGGNSQAELRAIVARVEDVERRRKACGEDRKVIMAEAKSKGFKPAYISYVVKQRGKKPALLQEENSLKAVYEHAVGLDQEPTLFRQLDAMVSDATSRDKILDFFKKLVPANGEIIAKIGDKPMRIWRDRDGNPQIEEWKEFKHDAPDAGLPPRAQKPDVPDVDNAGAKALGRDCAKNNRPVTENPFPFNDPRRALFDEGWREQAGNDGMGG